MKFGLYGLHKGSSADPETLARRARRAEAVGFESLWVGDHIALPPDVRSPAEEPRLEAVVALAHLAAVTTKVRLGVGVIVLPQREPLLLAKQLASIDVLSAGRLSVGIGVGYVEEELEAMGVSLAERGARTDEHLAAMQAIWSEGVPAFAGRFASFSGLVSRPLPVQRPRPPIIVGGHSHASCRRAARSGDGWYGWGLDPEQVAVRRAEVLAIERPPGLPPLEITVTPPEIPDAAAVEAYAHAGVDRLAIEPSTSEGYAIDELIELVGEELVTR